MRPKLPRWPALVLGIVFPGAATAQEGNRAAQGNEARNRELPLIDIHGDLRKPEVTMFVSRQNLDVAYSLVLRESFVPRIVESIEKGPF